VVPIENVVIGIFGFKGSGKTLLMVLLAYIEHLSGKRILMNMRDLSFPTEIIDPDDLISLASWLSDCTICIDELHTVADSRKSLRDQNIGISNFFLQSRHRGTNIIYTEQFQGQAEKRIRDNTDIKIVSTNLQIDSDNDGIFDMFEYTIMDMRLQTANTIKIYGKPVFDMYSSSEIVNIYDAKKLEKLNKQKTRY